MRCVALVALLVHCTFALRYIEVGNNRGAPIWIQSQPNDGKPPLRGGQIVKLNPSERTRYDIDDGGWAGRLWAKVGCDDGGNNCRFGQSIPPCPPNGCHPPAETKVEFFFPPINSPDASFYDISLVDGYSLAAEIIPFRDVSDHSNGSECMSIDEHLLYSTGKSIARRFMHSNWLSSEHKWLSERRKEWFGWFNH